LPQIIEERKRKNIVKDDFIGRLAEIIDKPEAPLTPGDNLTNILHSEFTAVA